MPRDRKAVGRPVNLPDGLYQVITDRFVAGFTVGGGRVIQCAPILRARLEQYLKQARRVDR